MATSGTYHIPFPKKFLAVNTPVKKPSTPAVTAESGAPAHGFLSNRPSRHQSVSSVSSSVSDTSIGAPPSPPTKAADSLVLAAKIFSPLPVNTKHTLPPATIADMTPVARSAFLSNRGGAGF